VNKTSSGGKNRKKSVFKVTQKTHDPTVTTSSISLLFAIPSKQFIPTYRCWRRFRQNAVITNQSFTISDGNNQFLMVTNASGAATPYVDMWRIKKIVAYISGLGSSVTQQSNLSLIPQGLDISNNFLNDREEVFDMSGNSTNTTSMIITPGKGTPLGSWHETSNVNFAGVLFLFSSSQANSNIAFLDIEFEVIPSLVGSPNGYTVVTGTTVVGVMGGRPWAAGAMLPVGTNNLV